MLQIKDTKLGVTFTDSQTDLAKLWEDHYIREDEIPGDYYATEFAVQFADGKASVVGWGNNEPCEPIELDPEHYEITLSAN